MASSTQQTTRRRKRRQAATGKDNKRARDRKGTPKFPIDPAQAGSESAEKLKRKG